MTDRSWRALGRILILLVAGLGAAGPAAATVSAVDFDGTTVSLAAPARRIVALTPHLVENLFTAGLGDRIVGAVRYSDYPPAARDIPRVGGYRSLGVEAIVARRPDLVVAWGQAGTADVIARLRDLGIAVYVDDPTDFAGIARTIRDLGHLGGTDARADRAADAFVIRMATLRQRYANRRPVSVFYAVATDPLITVSDDSMIGAAIRACGGVNVYGDETAAAPHVSMESLIARDPAAIVSARPNPDDTAWTAWWQRWPDLDAVAHDHFVTVARSPMSRPTVRMATATATLCAGLDRVRRATRASARHTARPASSQ